MSEPKKNRIVNFFKKILQIPVIRGTIKTLPFGNFVYELAENISLAKQGAQKVHHPQSLFIQFLWLTLIVYVIYGLFTGSLTMEQVAKFLGTEGFPSLPDPVDVTDSL